MNGISSSKRAKIDNIMEMAEMQEMQGTICSMVCDHCKHVTSRSISSLCAGDCLHGGGRYLICLAFWNSRHEIPYASPEGSY